MIKVYNHCGDKLLSLVTPIFHNRVNRIVRRRRRRYFLRTKQLTIVLFGTVLCLVGMFAITSAQNKPLSLETISNFLKKGVSQNRIAQLVQQHGVMFELDDKAARRLRQDGANEVVISAVRDASARYAEDRQRQRRLEEEKAKRERDETIRRQEEERRRVEEERRRTAEAEKKKQEEIRTAEEAKRQEEAARRRAEAERKKQEEARRIEQERQRAEEKRRADEEKKRAEEQRRQQAEIEKQKQDEAKKRIEAERQRAEEKRRLDEEKKRAEDQRRQRELEKELAAKKAAEEAAAKRAAEEAAKGKAAEELAAKEAAEEAAAKRAAEEVAKKKAAEDLAAKEAADTEAQKALRGPVGQQRPQGNAIALSRGRPEWKLGNQWTYRWKQLAATGTLTRTVISEEIFAGVPCYIVRVGKNENVYTKDGLGLLATRSEGKLIFKRDAPYLPLSWPLEVGKTWNNSFILERFEEKSSRTYHHRIVIAKSETVHVPAGVYDCFKIEVYSDYSSKLLGEYWYSPQVRWFVRWRTYEQNGVREEELLRYKIVD